MTQRSNLTVLMLNSFQSLSYEPAFESLGGDYYDVVAAAEFPQHRLRFRNDDLLPKLGLAPEQVTDDDFVNAFGKFQHREPLLAMRYHGYQFGEYNPFLGDGRGFLYGQVRGIDGGLYDFGTKGSGPTPYSRGGDGRLTLKGGVREVIAAEALHRYGVTTSRCLSLIETGESLWRGDEPSPTRSSVMVRVSRSHIRFGTFERLYYFRRPDLTQALLDHVIDMYYPHLKGQDSAYSQFYAELVERVATLAAEWMSVGFCHGVLNTDNMSITGESFDYGPYAFLNEYDPTFIAAYFDYSGLYCYKNQPLTCYRNLRLLQFPFQELIPQADMDDALAHFSSHYQAAYRTRMLRKLGLTTLEDEALADTLIESTLALLQSVKTMYHEFFLMLREEFSPTWAAEPSKIMPVLSDKLLDGQSDGGLQAVAEWREIYGRSLQALAMSELELVSKTLAQHNPSRVPIRSEIEAIWEPIANDDNWQPFYDLLNSIRQSVIEIA